MQDGAIVGQTTAENPTKGNTFLIWRQGTLDDFELRLKYRITGGNSGVQYRSKDYGDFVVGGYQADIDSGTTYSGILYEEKGRGILAQRGERVTIAADGQKQPAEKLGSSEDLQKLIKPTDWNEYRIVAQGTKVSHFINGQLMSEVIDTEPGKRAAEGVLALQVHAGPPMKVEFKDLELKRLKLADGRKKMVLVAGKQSHGPGEHEHRAGGRGFGCTGAHYHKNWANDDFRKMMVNALVWTSGLEVPAEGVASTVTSDDLVANLDDKAPKKN